MLVRIAGKKFEKLQKIMKEQSELMEWQAVCKVLNISEDTNFVVTALGTSSKPEEGLLVTFFEETK